MKNIFAVIGALSLLYSSSALSQQFSSEEMDIDQISEQIGEQLADQLSNAITPMVEGIGSAMGTFFDKFSTIQVMTDVCHEEDQKSTPLTNEQAQEIIKAITPDHLEAFTIDLTPDKFDNFAKGKFNIDATETEIEITKSFCLCLIDDMMQVFNQIPNEMSGAFEQAAPNGNFTDNSNNNNQSYNVCGDDIKTSDFTKKNIGAMETLQAVNNEKQKAYVIIYINNLGIRIKTQNGEYKKSMEHILKQIDVDKLQQIIGNEKREDIQKRLQQKVNNKIKELQENPPVVSQAMHDLKVVSDTTIQDILSKESPNFADNIDDLKTFFENLINNYAGNNQKAWCHKSTMFSLPFIQCDLQKHEQKDNTITYYSAVSLTLKRDISNFLHKMYSTPFFWDDKNVDFKDINGFEVWYGLNNKRTEYTTRLINDIFLTISCKKSEDCPAEQIIQNINKDELFKLTGGNPNESYDDLKNRLYKKAEEINTNSVSMGN